MDKEIKLPNLGLKMVKLTKEEMGWDQMPRWVQGMVLGIWRFVKEEDSDAGRP